MFPSVRQMRSAPAALLMQSFTSPPACPRPASHKEPARMHGPETHSTTVLVFLEDPELRKAISARLREEGLEPLEAGSADEGLALIRQDRAGAVLWDLATANGMRAFKEARQLGP